MRLIEHRPSRVPINVFLPLSKGSVVALQFIPFVPDSEKVHRLARLPISIPPEEQVNPMGPMRDDIIDRRLLLFLDQRGTCIDPSCHSDQHGMLFRKHIKKVGF